MPKPARERILDRIKYRGKNWVFSATDFVKDFKRWEIDQALVSLEKSGVIKRVIRGLYYYPQYSEMLQESVAPDIHGVAKALARKYEWTIYPEGNTVLNYLGLSTQVVAKVLYLSDGPAKKYEIGGLSLEFKHKTLVEAKLKHESSMLVVQAMKAVGEKRITEDFLRALAAKYDADEWQKIKKDTGKVTGWVHEYITYIADSLTRGA